MHAAEDPNIPLRRRPQITSRGFASRARRMITKCSNTRFAGEKDEAIENYEKWQHARE